MDYYPKTRKIFKCKICDGDKLAEYFSDTLNNMLIGGLKIVCSRCAAAFNQLPLNVRSEFLQQKISEYYNKKQYVYALCEPDTEAIRYVGRTDDPERRLKGHIQAPRSYAKAICFIGGVLKSECNCIQHKLLKNKIDSKSWIAQLLAKDLKPVMNILEQVEPNWMVAEREIRHICQLVKEKHELLNSENQREGMRELIQKQTFSFLNVNFETLEKNRFINEHSWQQALVFHQVFSTDIDLKFDEYVCSFDQETDLENTI